MKIIKPLITILIIIAIVVIGLVVYTTCSDHAIVQRIDKTEPDKTIAPFEVATQTHIYLASKATQNDDGMVTMINWYERVKGKWIKHEDSITLPKILRPRVNRR